MPAAGTGHLQELQGGDVGEGCLSDLGEGCVHQRPASESQPQGCATPLPPLPAGTCCVPRQCPLGVLGRQTATPSAVLPAGGWHRAGKGLSSPWGWHPPHKMPTPCGTGGLGACGDTSITHDAWHTGSHHTPVQCPPVSPGTHQPCPLGALVPKVTAALTDGWLSVPPLQGTGTSPCCPLVPSSPLPALQQTPGARTPPCHTLPTPTPPTMQHKERGCPWHPRAATLPALHPGDVTCCPSSSLAPSPLQRLGTHSEMTSGGRFLGTALESTQNAVSRVQEQLGGQGGGRGGLRPSAGSQKQAKVRKRRRRRAES